MSRVLVSVRNNEPMINDIGGDLFHTKTGDPYPIMAWLMVTATLVIIFNLIADVAYGYLDPRVRLH